MHQIVNSRNCPICDRRPEGISYPYKTKFDGIEFNYLRCGTCHTVFVDPLPPKKTLKKIYKKSSYHDKFYDGKENPFYVESVDLLLQFINAGSSVLDYGCGVGSFIKICSTKNMIPFGVEFDNEAAKFASLNANCEVVSVDYFTKLEQSPLFDAIHLGDVLGHLPNPICTMKNLIGFLKPKGVLFIEGPLEKNPSLVYWMSIIFGYIKSLFKPKSIPSFPPTMLFRVDSNAQKKFLSSLDENLVMAYWEVFETGWPYAEGSIFKRFIARIAILLGGCNLGALIFGNRFKAILIKQS